MIRTLWNSAPRIHCLPILNIHVICCDKPYRAPPDSLSYYRLFIIHSKSGIFIYGGFCSDSILYYYNNQQFIKRFATGYTFTGGTWFAFYRFNIEGNVLMQRTQPDSAIIISYEKAYKERLQGKEPGYPPRTYACKSGWCNVCKEIIWNVCCVLLSPGLVSLWFPRITGS